MRCLVIILNPLLLLYYVIHDNKTIFIVIVIVKTKNEQHCRIFYNDNDNIKYFLPQR